jgi:hypothetical protein
MDENMDENMCGACVNLTKKLDMVEAFPKLIMRI